MPKGGDHFVYHVEADFVWPDFTLRPGQGR